MTSLEDITARVLGIKIQDVKEGLSRDNCEDWDSFNHLLLISEIEKEQGVSFTTKEVESIKTFDDLRKLTDKKIDAP